MLDGGNAMEKNKVEKGDRGVYRRRGKGQF